MKTAEARDAMVALVQEAYAECPAFVSWPQIKANDVKTRVTVKDPADNSSYVTALHEFCASGVKPAGRNGNDLVA
jgi:hypothetical protein